MSPPWGVKKEVLQFLLDFVSALLLLTEGGLEMGTEGEEGMPSTNGYSSYLGGDAFLELSKIKGQGGGFAPSKIHIAKHVST